MPAEGGRSGRFVGRGAADRASCDLRRNHSIHFDVRYQSARSGEGFVMKIILRQGRPEDAQRAGLICYEAFKNIAEKHGFAPDFPSAEVGAGLASSLLARSDIYSVFAELDGNVVGSNYLWENATIAGVGPIT